MRLRLLVPLTLFALGAVIAPACSSGDDDTAASTSNDRDSDADSGGDSSGGSSGSEDTTDPEDFDLGDIPDEIPGLGEMSDCFSLAATYGSLYFEALGGGDGAPGASSERQPGRHSRRARSERRRIAGLERIRPRRSRRLCGDFGNAGPRLGQARTHSRAGVKFVSI